MTEPNEVDRILGEMLNTGTPGTFTPNEYGKKKIAQAKQALLAEIKKARPKASKIQSGCSCKRCIKEKNSALTAYDKEIEWVLE